MNHIQRYQKSVEQGVCPSCHKNPADKGHVLCIKCLEKQRIKESQLKLQMTCRSCRKNQVAPNHTRCQICLDIENQKRSELLNRRSQSDSCSNCGQPSRQNRNLCQVCTELKSQYLKDKRVRRKSQGLCSSCGQPLDNLARLTCSVCRAKSNQIVKKVYHASVAQNLCIECHQLRNIESPSSVLCSQCYYTGRQRRLKSQSKSRYGGLLETIIMRDKGCIVCHKPWSEVGSKSNVVCHHIDGDTTHNSLDNLVLLCRKCHTVATYWISCPNRLTLLEFLLDNYPINNVKVQLAN